MNFLIFKTNPNTHREEIKGVPVDKVIEVIENTQFIPYSLLSEKIKGFINYKGEPVLLYDMFNTMNKKDVFNGYIIFRGKDVKFSIPYTGKIDFISGSKLESYEIIDIDEIERLILKIIHSEK